MAGMDGSLDGRGIGADPECGARAVFSRLQRLALLAGFLVLVALRLPRAWLEGRFLGEEGTVFFAYAWHRSAMDALWRSFGGYLNLAANAVTLIDSRLVRGGLLPLEFAPYLTMVTAMLVQALPAAILLTARGRWLADRRAIVLALLGIAIAPRTEEAFLTRPLAPPSAAPALANPVAMNAARRMPVRLTRHAA